MSDIELVLCPQCKTELDGTGTCINDCLADWPEVPFKPLHRSSDDDLTREEAEAYRVYEDERLS